MRTRFLNFYANAVQTLPKFPLINHGAAKLRPVYVGDVGEAVSFCAHTHTDLHAGKTYELAGEDQYTVKEILDYVYETTETQSNLVDFPDTDIAVRLSQAGELFPNPIITRDLVRRMCEDELPSAGGIDGFKELGMTQASFEKKAFNVLYRFRTESHFANISTSN